MFVRILSRQGIILIDGEYGNIVEINGEWLPGKAPKHFVVSEYRTHYGVSVLPDELSMQDLAYVCEDGQHVQASEDWRKTLLLMHKGHGSCQRYLGVSMGSMDIIQKLNEDLSKSISFVHETKQLSVWYMPNGHYHISPSYDVLQLKARYGDWGQTLVRPHCSAIYWHVAIAPHNHLYSLTNRIVEKEQQILLYCNQRIPIINSEEFATQFASLAQFDEQKQCDIMKEQTDSIMKKLPKLCSSCGTEVNQPHIVPGDACGDGVCEECFTRQHVVCSDCNKVFARENARYDEYRPLCAKFHQWGKDMGFI